MRLAYREFPVPPGLEALVACLWENEPHEHRVERIIPDGCLDLIWFNDVLVVAGVDTGPRLVDSSQPPFPPAAPSRTGSSVRPLACSHNEAPASPLSPQT